MYGEQQDTSQKSEPKHSA